jgi:lysophosphatidate acyltransferase
LFAGIQSTTGDFGPFKKGAFYLAIQHQIPIVPVVHSSYSLFYDLKKRIFNNGRVIVTALPGIPTTGLTLCKTDIEALMETTRNRMIEVFNATTAELK